MRIIEKELKEKVKIFENEDVIVKFDDLLQARFEMKNIHINYNIKTGFLHIEDLANDNEIKINIVSAYNIDLEYMNLQIQLDTGIEFTIMKK